MKELTDHIGHVGGKDEQEQTQRHCSEVLPQTPEGKTGKQVLSSDLLLNCQNDNVFS